MNFAIFVTGLVVYLVAMRQDLYWRTIPDCVSVIVIILGLSRWFGTGRWHDGLDAVSAAVILFVALVFAYRRGWLGGGDVKLMTATALLIGVADFINWFVLMTLIGGVLSLGVILWQWTQNRVPADGAVANLSGQSSSATVPYGIAISLSALWVLFQQTGLLG